MRLQRGRIVVGIDAQVALQIEQNAAMQVGSVVEVGRLLEPAQ
jgi:hypothetical protein